ARLDRTPTAPTARPPRPARTPSTASTASTASTPSTPQHPPAPPAPQPEKDVKANKSQIQNKAEQSNRSQLMEEIRAGVKLKPTVPQAENKKTSPETELMKEIRTKAKEFSDNRRPSNDGSDIPPPPPLPKAATVKEPGEGRDQLLAEISSFSRTLLKKTGRLEEAVSTTTKHVEPSQIDIFSDNLMQTAQKVDPDTLLKISENISQYLTAAMQVDWQKVMKSELKGLTSTCALEKALTDKPQYLQVMWTEISKYPDVYKQADVVSDESPKHKSGRDIVEVAMTRLSGSPHRIFRSDSQLGQVELKSAESILESMAHKASQSLPNEDKLKLLGNGYKDALFKAFCELPFMEGFEQQNGKVAVQKLKSAFCSSIVSTESAQQNICAFMTQHLANGFQSFTFSGLEARLKELEAALAAKLA
ncbi:WH2 domain-containing protein, partial [Vibrio parahaemolyticus]|uniref:WH2 domain-containing protein n=1 Tax=Vibrio parahaemolyticus TaxID=670 RepID=UPI000A894EE1